MKYVLRKLAAFIFFVAFMTMFYSCATVKTADEAFTCTGTHPVEISGLPICSECHKDKDVFLNHTPDYIVKHKFYALQKKQTCETCHNDAFCSDCHSNKEELKPGDKFKSSPERFLPHRGDYLTQHRIDGRTNPASCIRCHGRKNNERCKLCHK